MMANCDESPRRCQPMILSKNAVIYFCARTPSEKHEIRVLHPLGEKIEIFLADWMEITRGVREPAFS
jgi:hypothetical protein